jgi:hypothetical protein
VGTLLLLSAQDCVQPAAGAVVAPNNLAHLILKPSEVGRGYRLQQRPDGRGVRGYVTLDLCGLSFPSERLRTARLQVNYVHAGRAVEVSNEIVTYRQGGAPEAISEVGYAVTHCPRRPVSSTIQGVGPLTYRLAEISDPRLLPDHVALRLHVSGVANQRRVDMTTIAVYQVHANTLSGIYTYGDKGITVAEQIHIGLRAAEASAREIRRA